jgi:phosphatidylglycerophosphate synthase
MTVTQTEPSPTIDRAALLDLMSNPADRLWRYPIASWLLRFAMKTPLTPNHVTVFHTLMGVGAGMLVAYGTPRAHLAAALLFELRAIFDCLDGSLARAKKLSSPLGRALDQLGDSIAFMALVVGAAVHFSRSHGVAYAATFALVATMVSASCTAAWDFFKRRFTSLTNDGYDQTEDEYLQLCALAQKKLTASLWFSRFITTYQWLILSPGTLTRLRERLARGELPAPDARPEVTPVGRWMMDAAQRNDPELRAAFTRVSLVAGDNVFFIFALGLLTSDLHAVFQLGVAWAVGVWIFTVVSCNRLLSGAGRVTHAA